MTLISENSNSIKHSYKSDCETTIEEVLIPIDRKIYKIKTFASTHIGNYEVKTIRKADDWYETMIISNSAFDDLGIGYYFKKSVTTKLALDCHIESIWHVHHSCREGV